MKEPASTSDARLDAALVQRGLARSREHAKALIMAGKVIVDEHRADKPAMKIGDRNTIRVKQDKTQFASRGGEKLEGALDDLGFDPSGMDALDIGAATGGFTHCLLLHGARSVVAVDVGYGQMAWSLREDPRVTVIERTNARNLTPEITGPSKDLAVIDVSFIGLDKILAPVSAALKPGGMILALVKPQFEAGRGQVGKGGVVRDPEIRRMAIEKVKEYALSIGLSLMGEAPCRLPGPKGNLEHFLLLKKGEHEIQS